MKVIEPGHIYEVSHNGAKGSQVVTFINTNSGQEHPGAISQEFVRVLIDRLKFKDGQVQCIENADLLYHLRMVLVGYEGRAYRRKLDKLNGTNGQHESFRERDKDLPFDDLGWLDGPRDGIENIPCGPDGHLLIQIFPRLILKGQGVVTMVNV